MTNMIGSLLSLAVTASIALANGGEEPKNAFQEKSGWKPGSGINLADSDDFKLNLMNQLQVAWSYTDNDTAQDVNTFNVRRARTTLSGHAFTKNLKYLLRLDAVDNQGSIVKDAWAHWNFIADSNTVGLRMGQGKSNFGLEATGSSSGLYFVERSAASKTFSDQRSRGAWIFGSHNENRLRWNVGAQNGDVARGSTGIFGGEEVSNPDNELNFVGNVSFDPMGDITGGNGNESIRQGDFGDVKDLMGTIGAGVEIGNNRDAANTQDVDSTSININTAWMFGGGITVQGEVFTRSDDPDVGSSQDSTGWYAMATYTMPKAGSSDMQWGFGIRINQINGDDPTSFLNTGLPVVGGFNVKGDVTELSAVVDAFYHSHACKTQVEYTWQNVNPDAGADQTNNILRVQFQLLF
jgi:hypothetical protein